MKDYQTKRPRAATLESEIVLPETVNIAMGEFAVLCTAFDRARLNKVFLIVTPATVIGRHRRLVTRQTSSTKA